MRKKNVRFVDRRSDANLSRGLYRALDQRKFRDEPVLPRLHRGKRRVDVEYEVDDLPCSDYERMHMT